MKSLKCVYINNNSEKGCSDYYKKVESLEDTLKNEKYKNIYYEVTDNNWCMFYIIPRNAIKEVALETNYDVRLDKLLEDFDEDVQKKVDRLCWYRDNFAENVRKRINEGYWVNLAQLYYIKNYTDFYSIELEKKIFENRENIKRKSEEERKKRLEELKEEEEERQREEEEQKQRKLEKAEEKAKTGEVLYADEFEMLCNKYNVKLSIKFTGWLREHLEYVDIKAGKYMYDKGHKSTSIGKYATELKNAMSLEF